MGTFHEKNSKNGLIFKNNSKNGRDVLREGDSGHSNHIALANNFCKMNNYVMSNVALLAFNI